MVVLKEPHKTIEFVLAPAAKYSDRGVNGQTKNIRLNCVHLHLTLCAADLTETKDVHSPQRSWETYSRYHVRVAKHEPFAVCIWACCRRFAETKLHLSNPVIQENKFTINRFCLEMSICPCLPVLSNF